MRLTGNILLLLAILGVGLFLRGYNLTGESIWLDEGISIRLSHLSPIVVVIERAFNNHPPLYFIILHYWFKIFGDSLFLARSLSVIFGTLSIYLIYAIGRLVTGDRKTGLLSAFLVSISLFHIYYSQELRMYSLVVLLDLASMYLFIKLFKERSLALSAGYVVCNACLLYTHYSSWLLILTQNIYFFAFLMFSERKEPIKLGIARWLKFQGILFILYLPWLGVGIRRLSQIQGAHDWVPKPSLFAVFDTLREYAGSAPLFMIFLVLLVISVVSVSKRYFTDSIRNIRANSILWAWFLIPLAGLFAISRLSTSVYITKYTIVSSLAFYILIARGIQNLNNRYLKFFTIGLIIVLSSACIWRYYYENKKLPFREVAIDVEKRAKTGDLLIFNDGLCKSTAFDYYFKRADVRTALFTSKDGSSYVKDINAGNIEELWSLAEGHNRVWIILIHIVDARRMIKNRFNLYYKLLYHEVYPSRSYVTHNITNVIEVYLLEKR